MEHIERKPDLRVVKTRRVIRDSLLELMSERGLAKISISELCAKAGINRKTFYRHYREIVDVVTEIENDILEEFAEVFKSHNSSILDLGEAIGEISASIDSRREYFMPLLKHNPDLFSNGRLKAALSKMIAVSLKSGSDLADENTLLTASEFAVSGILALYAAWFDGGCEGDLQFQTQIAVKMVTRGLSAVVEAK